MTLASDHPAPQFAVNTTYEPYSNDPDYIAGNRAFVRSLELDKARQVLDLACGIGTLSDLLWEVHPDLEIVGVDNSAQTLEVTRAKFAACGRLYEPGASGQVVRRGRIELICASADCLPCDQAGFEAVVMGHSIHLLPDEHRLLEEVHRVLRPGGIFAFNTSFYAGTFVPGTEQVYHDWVKAALCYVQQRDRELRNQGRPGIRRRRGSVSPAFTKSWPAPSEWRQRLGDHGLETVRTFERTVRLTQYSFETIGAYAGFASVILSGYPVDIASEALQATAGPTLEAAGIQEVPRLWLEVTARKV